MKSSKTSFLRNCISGWNVRVSFLSVRKFLYQKKALPLHHNRANGTFPTTRINGTSSATRLLGANKEACLNGKISGPIAQLVRAPDS